MTRPLRITGRGGRTYTTLVTASFVNGVGWCGLGAAEAESIRVHGDRGPVGPCHRNPHQVSASKVDRTTVSIRRRSGGSRFGSACPRGRSSPCWRAMRGSWLRLSRARPVRCRSRLLASRISSSVPPVTAVACAPRAVEQCGSVEGQQIELGFELLLVQPGDPVFVDPAAVLLGWTGPLVPLYRNPCSGPLTSPAFSIRLRVPRGMRLLRLGLAHRKGSIAASAKVPTCSTLPRVLYR